MPVPIRARFSLRAAAVLAVLFLIAPAGRLRAAGRSFDDDFAPRSMRLDYFHSGTSSEEHISLDRVVSDGPWAGSRARLLDETGLGKYFFEIIDPKTNRALYSRGFSSIYGEWETTGEAKEIWRTFHESLRFPQPKKRISVRLSKRDAKGIFHELWSSSIDPASRGVNPKDIEPLGKVWSVFENGPAENHVDLLILGDGYSASEITKFHADVGRLVRRLFDTDPFKSRRSEFNVRALDLPSGKSGVSRPHLGEFRRSRFSADYSAFDSERYVLSFDNRAIRDAASAAPYDFFIVVVNERTYGGGGIFNCQATVAADSAFAEYVFVHEFGHSFAGLGDEYFTSEVAYETGGKEHPEPWEPNVTAHPAKEELKWAELLSPSIVLPTTWKKDEFEKASREYQKKRKALRESRAPEEEMEKLFFSEKKIETELFAKEADAGKVGAFEGAGYEAVGLFRPSVDCIMFSRNDVGFCSVCRRAIEKMIDLYAGR